MPLSDWVIIALYLLCVIAVGLAVSGKVRTAKDFAVSTSTYGAFVLFATLSAAFIGGGFSMGNASKVAQYGVGNIVALFGFSVSIVIVACALVPKTVNFSTCTSTGEIMRYVYGTRAQAVTGMFSFLLCAGVLGAQASAMGYMFNVFLGIDKNSGIVIGCIAVMLCSAFGGMRAVVATDVIQFIVLAVGTPMLLYFVYDAAGGSAEIMQNLPGELFCVTNGYNIGGFVSLFLTFALGEALVPPYLQRLLMGKDVKTTKKATLMSAFLSVPYFTITGLVGLFALSYFSKMGNISDTNSIMQAAIKAVMPSGLRGLVVASMFAVVITTADSFLNSASVSLVTDTITPIFGERRNPAAQLFLMRVAGVFTGIMAIVTAIKIPNVLDVLTFAYGFWSPMILVPLAGAILTGRGSEKQFFASIFSGAMTALIWKIGLGNPFDIDGSIIGFFSNAAVYMYMQKRKSIN
ncbi:MAG: sodium:solute symporter family protein [Clostridia bacterium]|nr:sodium:solute symporter family protein [Clostridia bacterium]